jgi:hypothetical protein
MAIGGLGVYGDDGIRGRRSGCLAAAVTSIQTAPSPTSRSRAPAGEHLPATAAVTTWVRSATIPRHHPLASLMALSSLRPVRAAPQLRLLRAGLDPLGKPVTNTEVDVLTWSSGERGVTSTAPYYALASHD